MKSWHYAITVQNNFFRVEALNDLEYFLNRPLFLEEERNVLNLYTKINIRSVFVLSPLNELRVEQVCIANLQTRSHS